MNDIEFYKKNCKSINSLTFATVKNEVIKRIKESRNSSNTLLFAEWLFHKLKIIWRASKANYDELFDPIQNAIKDCTIPPIKMKYINWNDVEYAMQFMYNFYIDRFEETFFIEQMLNDSSLLKWNQNLVPEKDLRLHFIDWIKKVETYEQQSNLLDVLLRFFPKDEEVQEIYVKLMGGKTLYENEQNVHDDDVNVSVLKAVKELYCWFKTKPLSYRASSGQTREEWLRSVLSGVCDRKILDGIFDRIAIDKTVFEFKDEDIPTKLDTFDILFLMTNYILSEEESVRRAMFESLSNELKDAIELCITGYVARIMNSVQGYTELFQIKIPFRKQLHAKLNYDIAQKILKLPQTSNVILGTYDEEYQQEYFDFIRSIVDIKDLYEQYGEIDVMRYLPSVLDTITGKTIWFIDENILRFKGEQKD